MITVERIFAAVQVTLADESPRDLWRLAGRFAKAFAPHVATSAVAGKRGGFGVIFVLCRTEAQAEVVRAEVDRLVACDPPPLS